MLEKFLQNNNLRDADDIDSLLELASLVRQFITDRCYPDIIRIVRYTVEHSYHEAFSWSLGILQEELEKADSTIDTFECFIGRSIPDFDEFATRLHIDFSACKNGFEKVYDKNGEIESFFNIITYRTGYRNIQLVSSENFDTRDNDYVQYKLLFASQPSMMP